MLDQELTFDILVYLLLVLGQNGTDKMASIESSINQAFQLPLTI